MFSFVEQLVGGIGSWLMSVLQWLLDRLQGAWDWVRGFASATFLDLMQWAENALPPSWVEFIEEASTALHDAVTFIVPIGLDWIFPFWACLSIGASTLTLCALIRLVRWVLAIIPTIGG